MGYVLLGSVLTLVVFGLARLIYLVLRIGWPRIKELLRYWGYRLKYRATWRDCISCQGRGEYLFDGGMQGQQGQIVPGAAMMWDCGFCGGTGKEKIAYTYRFMWLRRYLTIKKTPAEFERDQQAAEKVLGPASEWLSEESRVTIGGEE
jgi:hypothetical protein